MMISSTMIFCTSRCLLLILVVLLLLLLLVVAAVAVVALAEDPTTLNLPTSRYRNAQALR